MGDWLTTFLISRSFLLLEIRGQPNFFAVLKSIFVLKFFDDVVCSNLDNLHLPSYFTFRELHCAKIDHLNAVFSADCCFFALFSGAKISYFLRQLTVKTKLAGRRKRVTVAKLNCSELKLWYSRFRLIWPPVYRVSSLIGPNREDRNLIKDNALHYIRIIGPQL